MLNLSNSDLNELFIIEGFWKIILKLFGQMISCMNALEIYGYVKCIYHLSSKLNITIFCTLPNEYEIL